jgi:aspartate aminotransferase
MKLETNPNIADIQMPENLALAMKVMQFRMKCRENGCTYDYAHFAFGGSPFGVPEMIQQGLKEHTAAGEYGPAVGMEPLRKQITRFWKKHFELDVAPDRIVVMPGTKQAILQILTLMKGPLILPKPSWVGYLPIAQLINKPVIELPTTPGSGYRISAEGLAEAARKADGQSILILNSPNNPTGAVYSRSELEELAAVARKHNVIVISDEIYSMITYDPKGYTSMASVYPEGTFVVTGIAKYAGAGGYRLGFAIVPESCTEKQILDFTKVGAATYTNASIPIQFAAIAAFDLGEEMSRYIEVQRNIHRIMTLDLARRFRELPGVEATTPEGSFYFFADFEGLRDKLNAKGIKTGVELEHVLYDHPHHIAMVAGESLVMPPESLTFRVASVDYDGPAAMQAYLDEPPRTESEERAFVEAHAPRLLMGVTRLRRWIESL